MFHPRGRGLEFYLRKPLMAYPAALVVDRIQFEDAGVRNFIKGICDPGSVTLVRPTEKLRIVVAGSVSMGSRYSTALVIADMSIDENRKWVSEVLRMHCDRVVIA